MHALRSFCKLPVRRFPTVPVCAGEGARAKRRWRWRGEFGRHAVYKNSSRAWCRGRCGLLCPQGFRLCSGYSFSYYEEGYFQLVLQPVCPGANLHGRVSKRVLLVIGLFLKEPGMIEIPSESVRACVQFRNGHDWLVRRVYCCSAQVPDTFSA